GSLNQVVNVRRSRRTVVAASLLEDAASLAVPLDLGSTAEDVREVPGEPHTVHLAVVEPFVLRPRTSDLCARLNRRPSLNAVGGGTGNNVAVRVSPGLFKVDRDGLPAAIQKTHQHHVQWISGISRRVGISR